MRLLILNKNKCDNKSKDQCNPGGEIVKQIKRFSGLHLVMFTCTYACVYNEVKYID